MNDFVIENGVLKKYTGIGGDVAVPEGVTSIGWSAFEGCRSLRRITVPEGVTYIGSSAFERCINLESVTLPESLTCIGYDAFMDCTYLTSIMLPKNLTRIGKNAFHDCENLRSIAAPSCLTREAAKEIVGCFFECRSLECITVSGKKQFVKLPPNGGRSQQTADEPNVLSFSIDDATGADLIDFCGALMDALTADYLPPEDNGEAGNETDEASLLDGDDFDDYGFLCDDDYDWDESDD